MVILTTMIGFAVLIMGRQILWIFIAGMGFALGMIYGEQYLVGQPSWMLLLISSLLAVVGALLAYTLQRLAAGLAGFATGWYLTNFMMAYLRADFGQYEFFVPIIVGIICSILIMTFYDWGVIILSSIAGSAIIVSGMSFKPQIEIGMLISFAIIGIMVQAILYFQEEPYKR